MILSNFVKSDTVWFKLIFFYLMSLSFALCYQFFYGAEPCLICVHIRAYVVGLCMVSLLAYAFRLNAFLYLSSVGGFLYVSYLGIKSSYVGWMIEIGKEMAPCSMDPQYPSFIPLDKWLPYVFSPQGLCGDPLFLFPGVSMMQLCVVVFALPVVMVLAHVMLRIVIKSS